MDSSQVPDSIREELKRLTEALRNTTEYREYKAAEKAVEENPELKERLVEYRMMNYNLQQEFDPGVIEQKTEELDRLYEELDKDPTAARFLDAEMTFCRMMQELSMAVYAAFDIE